MVIIFLVLTSNQKSTDEDQLFQLVHGQVSFYFENDLDASSSHVQKFLSDVANHQDVAGVSLSNEQLGTLSFGDVSDNLVRIQRNIPTNNQWHFDMYFPSIIDRYLGYSLYFAIFLLLSILSVFVISRIFILRTQKPINRMITELKLMDGNDPNAQLTIPTNSEHAILVEQINQLLQRSSKHYNNLEIAVTNVKKSRENLKQLVAERTEALEKTASILARRQKLLEIYVQITSANEKAEHRIGRLLKFCSELLGLPYARLFIYKEDISSLVMQIPLGKNLPPVNSQLLKSVVRSSDICYRSGLPDNAKNECLTEHAPAAYFGLPLTYLGNSQLVMLLSSDISCSNTFSKEDMDLVKFCGQWIGAQLTQMEQATALHREKERAHVTLESITDAVITTDSNGVIDYMNPVAEMLSGYTFNRAKGQSSSKILSFAHELGNKMAADLVQNCMNKASTVIYSEHLSVVHQDGDETAVECSFAPLMGASGDVDGCVVIMHDVSHAREMAKQLSYNAAHDALTGLVNRREFERRLKHALDSARGQQKVHALLYLDLDQFKIVNDSCGHTAGDHLLQQLTTEMQSKLGIEDTLARLGGDEFGVLLENTTLDQSMEIADSIRQGVKDFRFTWRDSVFDVGVSIGLVMIENQVGRLAEVLSAADAACYAAKTGGRNRVHRYQADDEEVIHHRGQMEWVVNISNALQENRFLLFRQQIKSLQRNKHPHYEILLRMRYNDGRVVDPGAFIPAAERFDLMPEVDRWVVKNVCEYIANTNSQTELDTIYSVNLSGASIDDDSTLSFITNTFKEYEINPFCICFEITETTAILNLNRAVQVIRELKKIGCKFALDDFGAGVSTFSYLKSLPVDYLKIDGSFVRNIIDDKVDQSMVRAVNEIAHIMNLETIAEYVETEEIEEMLSDMGVDYAQGYWVDRPQPLEMTDLKT